MKRRGHKFTGYDAGRHTHTKLRKPARTYVSVAEIYAYTRLPEAEVATALNGTSTLANRS